MNAAASPAGPVSAEHILIVTASAELYGSDRSLLNTLDALVAVADVTIAFPAMGPTVHLAQELGARTLILPDFALRRRNLQSPAALLRWAQRIRRAKKVLDREHRANPFTLIYSNTFASGIGAVLQRSWDIAHVLHVRECPMDPRWQISALCRIADHYCQQLLCNSQYTKSLLTLVRPSLALKTRVVHNGIDMPDTDAVVVPNSDGPLRISCVGRIHPKKGQSILLDAAALARRDGREWQLHFFGDTLPEHQHLYSGLLAQVATLGLTDAVTWHGFVEGNDRYAHCDVAVVPSVYPEEFSLVCAEAQAMGLPVVATGPGGPSEILVDGTTGFIVAPRNAAQLYDALAKLDDDRALCVQMGAAGSRRTRSLFSREAYSRNVVSALSTVRPALSTNAAP